MLAGHNEINEPKATRTVFETRVYQILLHAGTDSRRFHAHNDESVKTF